MTEDEIKFIIQIFHAVQQKVECSCGMSVVFYIGVGLSFAAYPGKADDQDQPKRDLFTDALGFERCDEHGKPLVSRTPN